MTRRRVLIAALSLLVVALAGRLLHRRATDRPVVAVATVAATCMDYPHRVITAWVEGYPVMAVTPMPMRSTAGVRAYSYGTLWSSAFIGNHEPSAAIRLISDGMPSTRPDNSEPRLSLQLQGRTRMDLHGRIICTVHVGLGPDMIVDATAPA